MCHVFILEAFIFLFYNFAFCLIWPIMWLIKSVLKHGAATFYSQVLNTT